MGYKITIQHTREMKQIVGGEWATIGTEEILRNTSIFDTSDEKEPKTRIADITGYTPQVEQAKIVTSEIFSQSVDDLDLAAVIKAVNNI